MPVTLQVPFVYDFRGTDRHGNRGAWLALDRVSVTVPSVSLLPEPIYSLAYPGDPLPFLSWYSWENALVRKVLLQGRPASLVELERATELVNTPWWDQEWFDDHPSAMFRVPRRSPRDAHYLPVVDIGEYVVAEDERDLRVAKTRRTWSLCFEHDGHLYAPARPPTWLVRVCRGYAFLEVSTSRMPGLLMPELHFAIQQEDAARDFAARAMDVGNELTFQNVLCSFPSSGPGTEGGALESARAFALRLCKRLSGRKLASLSPDQVRALSSLRGFFERSGTDSDADEVLKAVEKLEWPRLTAELQDWQNALGHRREALEGHDPDVLAMMGIF